MKVHCKNCLPKEGLDIPEFTQSEKTWLIKMNQESPIKAVKFLMDDYNLSHLESKFIITHINKTYGQCNCCDFDKLDCENLNCPICGALNLNWLTDTKV